MYLGCRLKINIGFYLVPPTVEIARFDNDALVSEYEFRQPFGSAEMFQFFLGR
jgi:hypothetical protein